LLSNSIFSFLTSMFEIFILSLSIYNLNTIALGHNNSKNAWSSSSTCCGSLNMTIFNWAKLNVIQLHLNTQHSDCDGLFWEKRDLGIS
jgi:hypothetical protein